MRNFLKSILLCCILLLLNSCSKQVFYYVGKINLNERNEVKAKGILVAKAVLKEECKEDPNPERNFDGTFTTRKQYGYYNVENIKIIPLPLFEVDEHGENYSSNINQYLKWESKKILGFYTFSNGNFEGLLDWGPMLHYDFSTECNYFTIHNSNHLIKEPLWIGYEYLLKQGRDLSFLFGVRHFIETLWFIENDEVFVLDLKEMKVYDPDEFIKLKCDKNFIRDIANGGKITCNY